MLGGKALPESPEEDSRATLVPGSGCGEGGFCSASLKRSVALRL
jgi:hypothetical protein